MTGKDSIETSDMKDDKDRKKAKKEKKRKRDDKVNVDEHDTGNVTNSDHVDDNSKLTSNKKELLKNRRLEREQLLEKVPKVDENGISYTKQQIRLMRKRVQKGLHPIETSAEKHARLVSEAQIRKEVEAELADMKDNENVDDQTENSDGTKEGNNNDDDDDDDNNGVENHDSSSKSIIDDDDDDDDNHNNDYSYEKRPGDAVGGQVDQQLRHPIAKKKRAKPVPSDYVCSACKNTSSNQPPHWIYDCLYKKTIPGTNQVSRKKRGLHDPLETKLFVSGLPFDTTVQDVIDMFMTKANNASVTHCKLIKFQDTKRCKGQAYVTFATPDAAKDALRLNGTILSPSLKQSKQKKDDRHDSPTKELKLKITKVLNRALTKNTKK